MYGWNLTRTAIGSIVMKIMCIFQRENNVNNESKEEIDVKNEQRTNAYNSDNKDLKCITSKNPCKGIGDPGPDLVKSGERLSTFGGCLILLHV